MTHQYIATITPDVASSMLRANLHNRPISKTHVDDYAKAIKRGEWRLNGESIKLASDGTLLDGQHRLMAVIAAGHPITSYVTVGLEKDVFGSLDQGLRRKASDALAIAGEVNAYSLASAARAVVMLKTGIGKRRPAISAAQCMDTLKDMPSLRFWVSRYNSLKMLRKLMPSAIAGVAALYAEKHGAEIVNEFLEQLDSGAGLEKGSPSLALREKFFERNRGHLLTLNVSLAYMIKAMNAHITNKKLLALRMTADEKFPELV